MLSWSVEEYLSYPGLLTRVGLVNRKCDKQRETTVHYGENPAQHLLLVEPPDSVTPRDCGIIFLHGGGWRMGSPELYGFAGHFFAQQGFATALVGYRLVPHHYPAQVDDAAAGFIAARDAMREFGHSADRLILGGQSAGAHLAALLACNRRVQERHGLTPDDFAALLLVSGPLDFSVCKNGTIRGMIRDMMGSATEWSEADPLHHLDDGFHLPTLLLHGDRDPLVEVENTLSFARAINRGKRNLAETLVVEGRHHSDLAMIFMPGSHVRSRAPLAKAREQLLRWLDYREQVKWV